MYSVSMTKLTYFFLGISLLLWLVTNYVSMSCDTIEATDEKRDVFKQKLPSREQSHLSDTPQTKTAQVLKWLESSLPNDIPRYYSTCPPVLSAAALQTATQSTAQILTVIGEINLNSSLVDHFTSLNTMLLKAREGGLTLGDTVISSLISLPISSWQLEENDNHVTKLNSILESLRDLGLFLLSLAHQHSLDITEYGTTQTIHSIERAGIKWLGLNARQSEVLYIGGRIKVGVIAFCGVHGQCLDSSEGATPMPFAPNKFFIKSAKEAIMKLQQSRKVHHIVVLLHWGKQQSLYPDETALYIARHLSDVEGVSAIIGYHPQTIQGHAYFGNTLVIFSPGNFIVGSDSESLCWKKDQSWSYNGRGLSPSCQSVHPALRETLKERELETTIYKLQVTESAVILGHYTVVPLQDNGNVRFPTQLGDDASKWTTICGYNDDKCLSCKPF